MSCHRRFFFFNTYSDFFFILFWEEMLHLTKFNLEFFLKQNSMKGFTLFLFQGQIPNTLKVTALTHTFLL